MKQGVLVGTTWRWVHAYSCRRSLKGVEVADVFARREKEASTCDGLCKQDVEQRKIVSTSRGLRRDKYG